MESRRLETPLSLPKPTAPGAPAVFDCCRIFRFDGLGDDGELTVATPGLDRALRSLAKDIKLQVGVLVWEVDFAIDGAAA